MMRVAGWVCALFGVVIAALGIALMVMLGPDNRITTGPHKIETTGSVVVTAPRVITWSGVQVDVLAELPAQKPVFVGLGNTVDVQSLVSETARIEVTAFKTPWKPTLKSVDGQPTVRGAPTALDWWRVSSAGLGGASISTTLPNEPVSLAVVAVGASNLSGLEVTLAYGIKGGFVKGSGLLLVGVGAAIGGWLLRRNARATDGDAETGEANEEVVFVVVDEDGVERELTAAEVEGGGYDVVDEADLVDEEVVFVVVDEDGVERELTAAEVEAGGYDVVDDDESETT